MTNIRELMSEIRRRAWWLSVELTGWKYRCLYGMDIGKKVVINRTAVLDRAINPRGIHIGDYSRILRDVIILAHDAPRKLKADTYIGRNCIIGTRSIVMPGVHIGDSSVIGAGSVVTRDIPANCIAVGSPARVKREGVVVEYGKIVIPGNVVGGVK